MDERQMKSSLITENRIPQALYSLTVEYIQDHFDPDDRQRFMRIQHGIAQKQKSGKPMSIVVHKKVSDTMGNWSSN